ncbi:MAG: thiolase C-terminal domain-containing protein [candidate division WOR-3 bacterium]
MANRVAIVGIGATQFRSISPDVSYRELVYEAAVKAYRDAGIDPRRDVDTFVTCSEDYNEGTSIFDEYVPDQLGAALKQVHTIAGDGLHGVAAAVLQIMTGQFRVAVVEAHSKASNMLTPDGIAVCAQDPVFNRPLGFNNLFIAGLEMNRFLHTSGLTKLHCWQVVQKNRAHAFDNPLAGRAALVEEYDFANARPLAAPLDELDVAQPVDGAVVVVLADESVVRRLKGKPVWVEGIGWGNGAVSLESRDWDRPEYVTRAAVMAYRQAGIDSPADQIDFAEIDDTFSYKELQHLVALGLVSAAELSHWIEAGRTGTQGVLPVNRSGGALGMGYLYEANGLARLYCAVQQLRGEAGRMQLSAPRRAVVQSWRGLPTTSAAVAVLSV